MPRRLARLLVAGFVAATLVDPVPAAALDAERGLDELIVDHWTTDRGLPQNSVNALLETRDGYLWIATFGGLARFDGVRFRVFDGEAGNGLPSSRILSLLEDRAGRLWVGTQDAGVALRDGDRFVDPLPERLPSPVVWCFAEDREGAIWIGTEEGVVRFADGRLERFGPEQGLPGRWVRDLAVGDRLMGVVGGGGQAERVLTVEGHLAPVPAGLDLLEAGGLPEVVITAHDAMFTRGVLAPGETVLVHAVGSGVGTMAVQLAKAVGATVVGTARTAAKAMASPKHSCAKPMAKSSNPFIRRSP